MDLGMADRIRNLESTRIRDSEVDGRSVGLTFLLENTVRLTNSSVGDISVLDCDHPWISTRATTLGTLGIHVPTISGVFESVFHGEILASNCTRLLADVHNDRSFKRLVRILEWNEQANDSYLKHLDSIGPAIACPIRMGATPVGVIFLARRKNLHAYTEDDAAFVDELAIDAADVISAEYQFTYLSNSKQTSQLEIA